MAKYNVIVEEAIWGSHAFRAAEGGQKQNLCDEWVQEMCSVFWEEINASSADRFK